jgi:hypothetical protein
MSNARRISTAVLATILATLGLTLVGPGATTPVAAEELPPLEIGPNERIDVQLPQIVGNNAANEKIDPETCRQAVTTYCVAIPFHLNRPADMPPDEEFTLRFTMGWKVAVEDVEVPVLGEVTSNDMDFFIWNSPYVPTREDGEPTEYAASAATTAQPEKVSFNTPPKDDYWLVIVNFVGFNEGGVNLKISWDPEVFPSPFEDLGDGARPNDASAEEFAVTPSFTAGDLGSPLSGGAPAFFTPPGGFTGFAGGDVFTGLSSVGVDDGFIDGVEGDLDNELLAEAKRLTAKPVTTFKRAAPAAPAIVGFWLVGVPLALLAVAVVMLLRRRPAALSFG